MRLISPASRGEDLRFWDRKSVKRSSLRNIHTPFLKRRNRSANSYSLTIITELCYLDCDLPYCYLHAAIPIQIDPRPFLSQTLITEMAIPISLASRSLRCPRAIYAAQAPFTRGLALSSSTQANRNLANARLLSTISSPRSLKDYRGLRSASSSLTTGKPLSKWTDLQYPRIRSWQPVRMISSSRGLQQDKDERKITEKYVTPTCIEQMGLQLF